MPQFNTGDLVNRKDGSATGMVVLLADPDPNGYITLRNRGGGYVIAKETSFKPTPPPMIEIPAAVAHRWVWARGGSIGPSTSDLIAAIEEAFAKNPDTL